MSVILDQAQAYLADVRQQVLGGDLTVAAGVVAVMVATGFVLRAVYAKRQKYLAAKWEKDAEDYVLGQSDAEVASEAAADFDKLQALALKAPKSVAKSMKSMKSMKKLMKAGSKEAVAEAPMKSASKESTAMKSMKSMKSMKKMK